MKSQELFSKCSLAHVVMNIITVWGFSLSFDDSCQGFFFRKTARLPASGYSAKYLRDSSGLGHALLYIRQLQMNIDISTEDTDGTDFDLEVRRGFLTL